MFFSHNRGPLQKKFVIPTISALLTTIALSINLLPWFLSGLYGLDWSDTSYHFQQALNVYNGLLPQRDFHSHVPGLSFVIESKFLSFFGPHFLAHRALGILAPSIVVFSVVYVSLDLLHDETRTTQIAVAALISLSTSASFWGEQLYFSFSAIGGALGFLTGTIAYKALKSQAPRPRIFFILLASILIGAITLIKQSLGAGIFLATAFAIFLAPLLLNTIKPLSHSLRQGGLGVGVLFFGAGFSFFLIASLMCGSCARDLGSFLGGGLELKGLSLSAPMEIAATIIGLQGLGDLWLLLLVSSLVISALIAFFCIRKIQISAFYLLVLLPFGLYELRSHIVSTSLHFAVLCATAAIALILAWQSNRMRFGAHDVDAEQEIKFKKIILGMVFCHQCLRC